MRAWILDSGMEESIFFTASLACPLVVVANVGRSLSNISLAAGVRVVVVGVSRAWDPNVGQRENEIGGDVADRSTAGGKLAKRKGKNPDKEQALELEWKVVPRAVEVEPVWKEVVEWRTWTVEDEKEDWTVVVRED
eukprot:s2382_g10.t1